MGNLDYENESSSWSDSGSESGEPKKKQKKRDKHVAMARLYGGVGTNKRPTNQYGIPTKGKSISPNVKKEPPKDPWKNKQYWSLPESVRKAIDIAQNK